ncbi:MAG: T9SS type A sorting domain-containing protein [Vicingaceae bacterium]
MRTLILNLLIIIVWAPLGAQTFEKTIKSSTISWDLPVGVLINENDQIIITSNINELTKDSLNRRIFTQFYLLSNKGEILNSKKLSSKGIFPFIDTSFNWLGTLSGVYTDNIFIFSATLRTAAPYNYSKLFYKLDSDFNLIDFTVNDTLIDSLVAFETMDQIGESIFLSGHVFEYTRQVFFGVFGKIDQQLNESTNIYFNTVDSLYLSDVNDFLIAENGDRYLFSGTYSPPPNYFTLPIHLIHLDSNNRLIKKTPLDYPSRPYDLFPIDFAPINSFWTSDSTFLIATSPTTTTDNKADIQLFVYDTAFNRLNYKRIGTRDTSEYSISSKGAVYDSTCNCFYFATTKRTSSNQSALFGRGDTTDFHLIKFDKDLNIIFDRYYRRDNTLLFSALNTDSEGNVIMVGSVQETDFTDSFNRELYILKVDSNGNYNPVGLKETDKIDKLNYSIFPNPSSGQFTFRQYNVMERYQFTLFDSQGRKVEELNFIQSNNEFNINNLPDGVYLYQLRDSKGRSNSGKIVKQ